MSYKRRLAALAAGALLVPLAPGTLAHAADPSAPVDIPDSAIAQLPRGPVLDLAAAKGERTYIVQLSSPALPNRVAAQGNSAAAKVKGNAKAYGKALQAEQADLEAEIAQITGSSAQVKYSYTRALNGIAVRLTRAEALKVSRLPGVTSVKKDFTRKLMTDVGPEWIGADKIWNGSATTDGVGNKGEGVVVGILDTGINPANPSFADIGKDGYNHTNPWGAGTYAGVCDPADPSYVANWGCNDKLIGYWNFEGTNVYDDDGHGSHTGSTAAGNFTDATTYSAKGTSHEFSVTREIKGVAPHANVVGYDVCDGAGCQGTAILAGIDQAIADGVDVINYSIGSSSPSSPWLDDDTLGFLNARAAGINVATSAGNDGPGPETLGGPADAPWITSVGATTHNRQWQAEVKNISAPDGATLAALKGVGFSGPAATSPLVYAGNATYNNPKCEASKFAAGTNLTGKIVICDRGTNGRVEKGEVVAALGAAGMVLANDQASGASINADAHALPAVHLTYADGSTLKAFVAAHAGTTAALSGGQEHLGADVADKMAAFSSRGPNRAISLISPSVSAPGVDILAAAGTDNATEWHFISGTSMASPHTAGALALLVGEHPTWSPAEIQSALMTTALRDVTDSDGTKPDWFDMGSGRIDLTKAAKAGLLLNETGARYLAADPGKGGDVRALNTASMADNECLLTCSWTRTLKGTSTGVGTWTVTVENSPGLTLTTDKASLAVTNGASQALKVTATVDPSLPTDTWVFGTVVLTPPAGSAAPVAHLPVAVLPSSGVLPEAVDITTRRDAGSQPETGLIAKPISNLQLTASGLVPGTRKPISVPLDTTNRNPYDGNGVHIEYLDVPAGAKRLVAQLEKPTASDFDMYVGVGAVSEANMVAMSAKGGSNESVDIADPAAGRWWVLVQNWEAAPDGDNIDTADLVTAVVAGSKGNLRATGPTGPIAGRTPFDIRVFWDEPALEAGQTWYGALAVGSAAGHAEDIGVMPVTLHRVEDDVTKTANVETARPGDVITYTVDIQPNVAREDFKYSVSDKLPAGTTYVDGSATNGAKYANGVVTWNGTLEAPSLEHEAYDVTTSATDPSCVNPATGDASYFNLADLGIAPQAAVTGDGKTFRIGAGYQYGLYETYDAGIRFSDDGFVVVGAANYGGSPGTTQSIPDPALPNNVMAMLWQDMEFVYDAASGSGVSIASDGAGFYIIEFDNMRKKGDPTGAQGTYDFEVINEPGSNDWYVAYDNLTGPLSGVTIGTENADGSGADALVNKASATGKISNGTVVCMTSKPKDVAGASFTYQVKVNADVANHTELINQATHTVDNPGAKPVVAKDRVIVTDTKYATDVALSLNPDQIMTGESTVATAKVFTSAPTPATGQVQFLVNGAVKGTGTLNASGVATATLTDFNAKGVFPVTAKYLGDATNAGSTSAPANLAVGQIVKSKPKITVVTKKVIKKGKKATIKVIVSARNFTPSGTVKIKVRGAVKKKTYTLQLNAKGIAKVTLKKAKKIGRIKGKVVYAGDAATLPAKKKFKIRVVR